jgi:hypothetical protein
VPRSVALSLWFGVFGFFDVGDRSDLPLPPIVIEFSYSSLYDLREVLLGAALALWTCKKTLSCG